MVDLVIRAAGVVLIRRNSREPKVLLVHRPRHHDWSLPKGKLDEGEHMIAAAVRECDEETGVVPVLGAPLPRQSYSVMGRPKTVEYWIATPGRDLGFTPDDEIDQVMWVTRSQARSMLSYKRDVELVNTAMAAPETTAMILLRHATAIKRADHKGDDERRPLAGKGRSQARALVSLLLAYGIDAIHTSDATRCVQTVRPFADAARVTIEEEPLFSEPGYAARSRAALERLEALVGEQKGLVICTHRPVLPDMIAMFSSALGNRQTRLLEEPLKPGAFIVMHRQLTKGRWRVVAAERHNL